METCNIALKEWSVACRALEEGRQIILIRKGGLLDAEGSFAPEYSRFWLMPTKWHQDANLLKFEHHDLLQNDTAPSREALRLASWAEVVKVWSLDARQPDVEKKLMQLDHIWSSRYLDTRLGFQTEKPLSVVALRTYVLNVPHEVPMRSEYSGCKSWVELRESLPLRSSLPVFDNAAFEVYLRALGTVFGAHAKLPLST